MTDDDESRSPAAVAQQESLILATQALARIRKALGAAPEADLVAAVWTLITDRDAAREGWDVLLDKHRHDVSRLAEVYSERLGAFQDANARLKLAIVTALNGLDDDTPASRMAARAALHEAVEP